MWTPAHDEVSFLCQRAQWFVQLTVGTLAGSWLPCPAPGLDFRTEEEGVGLYFYGILFLKSCQPVQADIAPGSYIVIPNGDGNYLGANGHSIPPEFDASV
jgi:hypothetical protein